MAFRVSTVQEITDRNIANFEAKLNQESPLNDKAFIRVISAIEAMTFGQLSRYAADRILQTLALTAGEEGLEIIGRNYNVIRKPAIAAVLEIQMTASTGAVLSITTSFIGDPNNVRYFPIESASESGGYITVDVRAEDTGAAGNLNVSDTLTIGSPVSGIGSTATVQSVSTTGTDQEALETYRRRVLTEIRTVGGGGNAVDYRTWAEVVSGVERAFPYAGAPLSGIGSFVDGNMEAGDTSAWPPYNSATITKETVSPHSGLRNLKIAYNGVPDPHTLQSALTTGREYRIHGWARSDGTYVPSVALKTPFLPIWTGTTSTSWQEFDVTVVTWGTDFMLYSNCTGAGYVEYDDIEILPTPLPGDRTIYIEATSDLDPDGIPPSSLLDSVRDAINYDPVTGQGQPPLGETNQTLYVEPIIRTGFVVKITNLDWGSASESEVKSDITDAVSEYFRSVAPFVDSIDSIIDKNDVITKLTLSSIVQDILTPIGGSADKVEFGLSLSALVDSYELGQGELAKLITPITWA